MAAAWARRLRTGTLRTRIGPFTVRLASPFREMGRWLPLLYRDYPLLDEAGFSDFHIRIGPGTGIRRWWRPQARFFLDADEPFKPLPRSQALPFFEWGLNWCIARHAHQFLIIHAAVVARGERALILPGEPGAGKSTLCAELVGHGWRLLSDELALLSPESRRLTPVPRPIGLKGPSIELIRDRFPTAEIGPACRDTAKGTVAHLLPPAASVAAGGHEAVPVRIVFPRFRPGAALRLTEMPDDEALRGLLEGTFNFPVQGVRGFNGLIDLVEQCGAHCLEYADLDEARSALEGLIDNPEADLVGRGSA